MTNRLLTTRGLDDILAVTDSGPVRVARFVGQALELAERLPQCAPVLNLCQGRYAFAVTFAATLIARGTNLLPPDRLPATLESLRGRYPDSVIVGDRCDDPASGRTVDVRDALRSTTGADAVPAIHGEQIAAMVFTSGTTGKSSAIRKPWRTLHESSLVNVAALGLDNTARHLVATVPPQHMWGLETSVLAPWFSPLTLHSGLPFFVADIVAALEALPAPRVLVSTPVHLRAMIEDGRNLPIIDLILSATAPLAPALAARLESRCRGRVVEVYGCSETGCLARRAAALDEPWQLFPAFELIPAGEDHTAYAAHLPESVTLMDRLDIAPDGRFRLVGRHGDLINIAGKRASLSELTQTLLEIPGVVDGVIFQPPGESDGPVGRLAALVVAPGLSASDVRRLLAARIDGAFLPRPLNVVDKLPRAPTGKLPQQALMELHRDLVLSGP